MPSVTAPSPLPVGVVGAMAAAIQGGARFGVYVFGSNVDGSASARSFYLAPGATAWTELEPMPVPRAASAAVAIGEDATRDTGPRLR